MNTNHDRSDDSNIDLETSKLPTTTTKRKSLSSYLTTEIDKTHSDLPILACCLVSGFCDSGVYASWQCFVSMQTGKSSHSSKTPYVTATTIPSQHVVY